MDQRRIKSRKVLQAPFQTAATLSRTNLKGCHCEKWAATYVQCHMTSCTRVNGPLKSVVILYKGKHTL